MGRSILHLGTLILAAWTSGGSAPATPDPVTGKDSARPGSGILIVAPASPDTAAGKRPADSSQATRRDTVLMVRDSGQVDTVALKTGLYEYVAHPILQVLTLPVEKVLVPGVKALIYPVKSPIRYVLKNDVIDRTIQLISLGESEQVMLYPTLNLAPGTGSYTGLTLRHQSVFGRPTERLVAMGLIFVNGDWKFRTYLTAADLAGTGFDSKVSLQFNRIKNTSIFQPGHNLKWAYADTSNAISLGLSHGIFEKFSLKGTYIFRDNHFGLAPPGGDSLVSEFFRNDSGVLDPAWRGLEKDWFDHIVAFGISRDTRNNENIPLAGTNFSLNGRYHMNDENHNFAGWEGIWTGYYKLGKERYEITVDEERKAGPMNIKKVLRGMEMKRIREQLLNRKVLVLRAYAAQSYEVGGGNRMPTYGLMTLGNDTPLRGYGGSRFRDYTVASVGAEYRFPVLRLLEGMIFNEYGVYGRSWDTIDYPGVLKNSWGFGINVRRPDIHLFRVHLGFHGLHGIQLNLSVDTYY